MTFKKFERWRHDKCGDMDIIVVDVLGSVLGYQEIKVLYYNRHYDLFIDNPAEIVKISNEELNNWRKVT